MDVVLHILLSIHHRLDPNTGAPGVTWALGKALADRGHRIRFMSFDDMGAIPPRLAVLAYPPFLAARLGRAEGVDVIDASTGDTWLWAALRKDRRRPAPLLVSRSHGLEHLFHKATAARARHDGVRLSGRYHAYHGGYRLWEVAKGMRQADVALFLNPAEREFAVDELKIAPERAHVVPNGIPDYLFVEPIDYADDPAGPVGIAMIGAWRPLKGTAEATAALSEVLVGDPAAKVSLLGTGVDARTVLAGFAPELRGRIRVVPRYRRPELPQLLRGHQVQIFPSLSEGFGLGLLEGMACGLAPVAAAGEGPLTFVRDGGNGLVVAPGDTAGIVTSLRRLLGDRTLLHELQTAARATAGDYGLGTIAARTEAIYVAALDARAASARGQSAVVRA